MVKERDRENMENKVLLPKDELAAKQTVIERIRNASLSELIDWALETYHSEENKKRRENDDQLKFIAYLGRTIYGKLLGFTQKEFFENAERSFAAQLKEKLFVHYILEEDTPFNLHVGVDLGTALEATLFGMDYVYPETADPTYQKDPLLNSLEDYKKLTMPDFYKSGWMPEAHRLYQEFQEISRGRFDVYFPGWARGPWSMATILRGFNNTFEDYLDDPEGLAGFLMFMADARIYFENQRLKYLGLKPEEKEYRWLYCSYRYNYNSDIFEDEVDGNLFSANMNREIIIPAQKKLSDYYGGSISYYHSCGDLTSLYDDISGLNVVKYQHISPLSFQHYEKFDRLMKPETIAQVSLKATDVLNLSDVPSIEEKLIEKMSVLNGRKAEICADALFAGDWKLIENVMQWRNVFYRLKPEYEGGTNCL